MAWPGQRPGMKISGTSEEKGSGVDHVFEHIEVDTNLMLGQCMGKLN